MNPENTHKDILGDLLQYMVLALNPLPTDDGKCNHGLP